MNNITVLITGAAGNLGTLSARHFLANSDCQLKLMYHKKTIPEDILREKRVRAFQCDLAEPSILKDAVSGADVIIHFAGILFKASPEKFLPVTNTAYFKNLVKVAKEQGVKKIILISFPHVEGATSPWLPSTDRTDRVPVSVHASTRLEEEKILLEEMETPVILRVGMVYGRGILMPDAARWFARLWLLGVWREPTHIHLISKWDFCASLLGAAINKNTRGIYNIGDEGVQTLQEYLDFACSVWETKKPWRMPLWMIYSAAFLFETFSRIFKVQSPLTKDFIDIGRVSYYGDTGRMREELLPELRYRTMQEGKSTF